ncbi:hypothetical protein FQA39_LY14284 [Lamprigera yunnana]|nr:hypothetical protein FQA39_LY14284 [Lamprigera yunnana]
MDLGSKNQKRKCTYIDQVKSSRRKFESKVRIRELSDCVLLKILKWLDVTSLFQFGKTCQRFHALVQDQSLWVNIDARAEPNTRTKIDFCWLNVTLKTKRLLLSAQKRSECILSWYTPITSPDMQNISVLALEHQSIRYVSTYDNAESCTKEN